MAGTAPGREQYLGQQRQARRRALQRYALSDSVRWGGSWGARRALRPGRFFGVLQALGDSVAAKPHFNYAARSFGARSGSTFGPGRSIARARGFTNGATATLAGDSTCNWRGARRGVEAAATGVWMTWAIGPARTLSCGSSGGIRRTTRTPFVGGSAKSPATPAANDSVHNASATAPIRRMFCPAKRSELTESRAASRS